MDRMDICELTQPDCLHFRIATPLKQRCCNCCLLSTLDTRVTRLHSTRTISHDATRQTVSPTQSAISTSAEQRTAAVAVSQSLSLCQPHGSVTASWPREVFTAGRGVTVDCGRSGHERVAAATSVAPSRLRHPHTALLPSFILTVIRLSLPSSLPLCLAMYQPSSSAVAVMRSSQSPHSATSSSPSSAIGTTTLSPHSPSPSPSLSTASTLSPSSITTTGSGRAVGIGPSRPHALSPPQPHPSIGSTAFPLLPRLEDMDELPHCSEELHSLTAILNNPTHPQAELTPLPLNPPPLPWSDKDLSLHSLSADLSTLHTQLQKFEANHGAGTFITLAEDDPSAEERRAAEQLRECLATVPARFFRDEVDCIEEAFAFIRDGTEDEAGLLLAESKRMNGRADSKPSSPVPSLPTSPPAGRGASQYDPKTLMYTRGPPLQQPAAAIKAAPAPTPAPTTAPSTPAPYPPPPPTSSPTPAPSTTRSFLSYITSAFSSTPAPAFQVPTLPANPNFLSSRRFASLSLSPDEEHRAAQLNASLSSYLDTLEVTLTSQIQLRSSSFFSSLFTINALNSDTTATIAHIASIREHIDTTQDKLTASGLTLLRRLIRRQRSAEVMAIVERLLVLRRGVARCRQLLDAGEYASVLVLMHKLRLSMWDDRMRSVKLIDGMDNELARVRADMKQTISNAFVRLVVEGKLEDDDNDSVNERERAAAEAGAAAGEERKVDGDTVEAASSKSKAESVVDRELREEEQEKLFLLSQCLYHLDATGAAMERYSEQLLAALQSRVLRYLRAAAGISEEEADDKTQLHVTVHGSQSSSPATSVASSASSSPVHHSTNPFDELCPTPSQSSPTASPSSIITSPAPAAPVTASPVKERLFSQALSAILPTARVANASHVGSPRFPTAPSVTAGATEPVPAPLNPSASFVSSTLATASSLPSSDLNSALTRHLSGLSASAYCDFLRGLFRIVLDGLHRVLNVRSVVVAAVVSIPTQLFLTTRDITPQYTDDQPPATLAETSAAITATFSSLLVSCTDWSHKECARILLLRPAEQRLPALSSLLSLLTSFISESESLTHSPVSAVRSCMSSLSSSYLTSFHSFHVSSLTATLSKEQWTRVDVPREFQAMVDSKYARKVATIHDTQPYTAATPSPSSSPPPTAAAVSLSSADAIASSSSPTAAPNGHHRAESVLGARVFFVESVAADGSSQFDKYPVVGSVLALLHSVSLYLDLASQLPMCAAEVSERLHLLLTTFSGRVYALILNAEAQKSAGLTTITTTQLALCAQCIGFVLTQLSVICGLLPPPAFTTPASSNPAQSPPPPSLTALTKEYSAHQRELMTKLESIMNGIADAAFKKVVEALRLDTNVAVAAPVAFSLSHSNSDLDGPIVDDRLKTLMGQTKSLNTTLTPVLSVEQRRLIFTHLCTSYCHMFTQHVKARLDLSRDTVRQRAGSAASYMVKQLYSLPGQDIQACRDIAQLLHIADIDVSSTTLQSASSGRDEAGRREAAGINGVSANSSEGTIDAT